jgi:predicted cupin superfamily sugar epimerase
MKNTAPYYIDKLNLIPHPEGGFYIESYRDNKKTQFDGFEGERNISTAIYFLLQHSQKSHFHKIKSDELWFHHDGNVLEIYILDHNELKTIHLGKDLDKGEVLQAVVPANVWFASKVKNDEGFVLVSCTVSPGFSFEDFEMANRKDLNTEFKNENEIISLMCLN